MNTEFLGTATYSPEDNKLRLYPFARLSPEDYRRVKSAGFIWAPKQELFVAPMWTPDRNDLLEEIAGEIGDEDQSLVERAEARAERFEDYSDKRAEDARRARETLAGIADGIPLGQPILVGHHSERHARRDAEKIENGMRKAVKMWETSQYWTSRAAGAVAAAKYKELPQVRARRIKKIEADKRRHEKYKRQSLDQLHKWETVQTIEDARKLAGWSEAGRLTVCRKEGGEAWDRWSAYDVLQPEESRSKNCPSMTLAQVQDAARAAYPRSIERCERWISHFENRLAYEKAMLADQGASGLLDKAPRPKQLPLLNYRKAVITLKNRYYPREVENYPQRELTAAQYARINKDYKGTREVGGTHRIRTAMIDRSLVAVFLTDSKVHEEPQAPALAQVQAAPVSEPPRIVTAETFELTSDPQPTPAPAPKAVDRSENLEFDAMRTALKAGVKVVSAPQLFPTPPELAARMVTEAGIKAGQRILEPSAGTGNIVRAITSTPAEVCAVEINLNLGHALASRCPGVDVRRMDFLECTPDLIGHFDAVLMNPPFANGQDIAHIEHARKFVKRGGRIVAICANGPRQNEKLKPMAEESGGYWEPLPAGTFSQSGTGVNTALLIIEN